MTPLKKKKKKNASWLRGFATADSNNQLLLGSPTNNAANNEKIYSYIVEAVSHSVVFCPAVSLCYYKSVELSYVKTLVYIVYVSYPTTLVIGPLCVLLPFDLVFRICYITILPTVGYFACEVCTWGHI